MPGDSCATQLLSITHEIYKSFDYNPSVGITGVFWDIPKALDKVCHDGLKFKLQTYGIDGKLLKLLKSYLKYRQQRVLLNSQTSSWKTFWQVFRKDLFLRPLLFLIHINDLPDGLNSLCKYLLMIHHFFGRQLIRKNLKLNLIKTWSWLANEHISGECYLILTLPNKLQKFASHMNVITFLTSF